MSIDGMADLGHRLAAEFPASAMHRGWTVKNLCHNFEQTPWGVEETWSCEFVGPRDLFAERQRVVSGDSFFTWRLAAAPYGSAEATTAEGLIEQVRQVIEALGLHDD